jgi:N-methylhydantoinase B/oxoprolinase/acetone carboxylase alpha subunit
MQGLALGREGGVHGSYKCENPYCTTKRGSGGGYGEAVERAPKDVLEDLIDGKVTPAHALKAYGVMLQADGTVDVTATAAARDEMRTRARTGSN